MVIYSGSLSSRWVIQSKVGVGSLTSFSSFTVTNEYYSISITSTANRINMANRCYAHTHKVNTEISGSTFPILVTFSRVCILIFWFLKNIHFQVICYLVRDQNFAVMLLFNSMWFPVVHVPASSIIACNHYCYRQNRGVTKVIGIQEVQFNGKTDKTLSSSTTSIDLIMDVERYYIISVQWPLIFKHVQLCCTEVGMLLLIIELVQHFWSVKFHVHILVAW